MTSTAAAPCGGRREAADRLCMQCRGGSAPGRRSRGQGELWFECVYGLFTSPAVRKPVLHVDCHANLLRSPRIHGCSRSTREARPWRAVRHPTRGLGVPAHRRGALDALALRAGYGRAEEQAACRRRHQGARPQSACTSTPLLPDCACIEGLFRHCPQCHVPRGLHGPQRPTLYVARRCIRSNLPTARSSVQRPCPFPSLRRRLMRVPRLPTRALGPGLVQRQPRRQAPPPPLRPPCPLCQWLSCRPICTEVLRHPGRLLRHLLIVTTAIRLWLYGTAAETPVPGGAGTWTIAVCALRSLGSTPATRAAAAEAERPGGDVGAACRDGAGDDLDADEPVLFVFGEACAPRASLEVVSLEEPVLRLALIVAAPCCSAVLQRRSAGVSC